MKKRIVFIVLSVFNLSILTLSGQQVLQPIDELDCEPGQPTARFYRDRDGDGFGDPNFYIDTCERPSGYVFIAEDCNDNDASIKPRTWYPDNDNDGYGVNSGAKFSCLQPLGNWSEVNGDCDDSDPSITNELTAYYIDRDKDGEGDVNATALMRCSNPSTQTTWYATTKKDCDDNDASIQMKRWYRDDDQDRFGDPNNFKDQCSEPFGNWVLDNTDACPAVQDLNTGCPPAGATVNELWNTIQITEYDRDEVVKGKTKAYYDDLGKVVQNQSIDIKTGKTWASQTLYDSQGRPAVKTLSAPTNGDIPSDFLYRDDLILDASGNTFDHVDFETGDQDPATVSTAENTIGWYYSTNNVDNPTDNLKKNSYQDITNRPYSRTVYSELNPGKALKSLGGNKKGGDWKQGYSFTMKAGQELSRSVAFGDTYYNDVKTLKTVVRDVRGVESVVFTDTDGKTLAAARSGEVGARSSQVTIGEQGYVDIHHVPDGSGSGGLSISNTSGVSIQLFNLISEETTTASSASLKKGFYRVAVTNLDAYTPNTVTITYKENYYDYSLNEYDKAGRLVSTTQPLGDELKSIFKYNSLGQLEYTSSPDEGEAWFKYRKDGQIRYSQNSKQRDPDKNNNFSDAEFSYTNYDSKGRPVESGVVKSTVFTNANPDGDLPSGTRSEVQSTVYDKLSSTDLSFLASVHSSYASPGFLAGNVAKTNNANSTTYYSYDVYGRVTWMVQTIAGLGTKTIDYSYDPVTSEVLRVDYQKHIPTERFIHKYTYNTVGQLTEVKTGASDADLKVQATYDYYETGALRRKEIGNGLQGMDYVYTLEGALKSINHPDLTAAKDPGGDDNDLFGMTIHYNSDDYMRTGTPKPIDKSALGTDQYNGNIKGIEWKTHGMPKSNYYYDYNRNNWLEKADFNLGLSSDGTPADLILESPTNGDYRATNSITLKPGFVAASGTNFSASIGPGSSSAYRVEGITYDANGNILKLKRNSATGQMDNLDYKYKDNTNQLDYVDDVVTGNADANDIKDQNPGNYTYNKIGQLTHNTQDGTTYTYNTAGLVTEVTNGSQSVRFAYDDKGQRVKKEVWNGSTLSYTYYYVRDAAGSVIAIYTGNTLEHPVYGASRIGVAKRTSLNQTSFADNNYLYELTDHLGNVRAVAQRNGSQAVAIVKTDYYPFGMPLPGRDNDGNQSQYRYKYQGQEKDSETGKEAFELRLWDARIGRWLTTDPYGQYASPYLGMGNNPINGVDPDGGLFGWIRASWHKMWNGGEVYKNDFDQWVWNSGVGEMEGSMNTGYNIDIGTSRNFGYAFLGKIEHNVTELSITPKIDFGVQVRRDGGAKGFSSSLIKFDIISAKFNFLNDDRSLGFNSEIDYFLKNNKIKGKAFSASIENGSFDQKWGLKYEAEFIPYGIVFGPRASTPVLLLPKSLNVIPEFGGGTPYTELKISNNVRDNSITIHGGLQEDWGHTYNYGLLGIGGKIDVRFQGSITWKL
ncbi:RHS repeat domain-containing protein [Leeuwenhoekiella sp. H156]|uniref:RHS repeat domain-containing protein n=1 Tax=Leeuwenhoekiella sp. H156 TaxID=3450128 RepID=UPI003FA4D34A